MADVVLMVGTHKGAFFLTSDESRETWSISGPHMKGWEVGTLTLDGRSGSRILAGIKHEAFGPAIQISDDLGRTWREIKHRPAYSKESGFKLNRFWTLALDPSDEKTLYAGVDEAGLFKSLDGGEHWEEVSSLTGHETREEWYPGAGGLCVHSILINPKDPRQWWVGISAVGVFRSDDAGASWELKNDGLAIVTPAKSGANIGSCVHALVMDPVEPGRLYQQNHQGVFRSTNGGDSWERIEQGLPSRFGFPMAMNPRETRVLYTVPLESDEYRIPLEGGLAVYRTTDRGDSWTPMTDGLPRDHFYSGVLRHALDVDGLPETGIYLGTTGGNLFFSRAGGDRWESLPGHFPRILTVRAEVVD